MEGSLQNLYPLCPSMGLAEGSAGFWSCVCLTTLGLPPNTMRLNLDPQIKSSTFCSTFDNASLSGNSHFNGCEMMSHHGFNLHVSENNWYSAGFHELLLAICRSSSAKLFLLGT